MTPTWQFHRERSTLLEDWICEGRPYSLRKPPGKWYTVILPLAPFFPPSPSFWNFDVWWRSCKIWGDQKTWKKRHKVPWDSIFIGQNNRGLLDPAFWLNFPQKKCSQTAPLGFSALKSTNNILNHHLQYREQSGGPKQISLGQDDHPWSNSHPKNDMTDVVQFQYWDFSVSLWPKSSVIFGQKNRGSQCQNEAWAESLDWSWRMSTGFPSQPVHQCYVLLGQWTCHHSPAVRS